MRARIVPVLCGLAAAGAWAAGCSSASVTTASVTSASRPAVPSRPLRVRCTGSAAQPRRRPPAASQLPLPGSPDGIATTPDGRTSFVALQSGAPRVAVIANGSSGPRLLRTVVVPRTPSGLRVTPDGRYALAAAGTGAVVLDVAAARSGSGRAVLTTLSAPARVAGHGPGAAEVAVSPDSRHAFVTLEGAGVVAVFDLPAALAGARAGGGYLGAVRVGAGALGIATAADGRSLYEVSESARVPGHGQGALNVIDLRRAVSEPRAALLATAPAPCAPVRVAVSPRGDTVWVTARNGNALLGFATAQLVGAPDLALRSVTRVGPEPLGLAVVDGGRRVLVADADLADARQIRSGVAVVAATGAPRLVARVASGPLADAIAPAADGRALVTESGAHALLALNLAGLP